MLNLSLCSRVGLFQQIVRVVILSKTVFLTLEESKDEMLKLIQHDNTQDNGNQNDNGQKIVKKAYATLYVVFIGVFVHWV